MDYTHACNGAVSFIIWRKSALLPTAALLIAVPAILTISPLHIPGGAITIGRAHSFSVMTYNVYGFVDHSSSQMTPAEKEQKPKPATDYRYSARYRMHAGRIQQTYKIQAADGYHQQRYIHIAISYPRAERLYFLNILLKSSLLHSPHGTTAHYSAYTNLMWTGIRCSL